MTGEPKGSGGVHDSVLETIGRTPLIRLHRVGDGARTPLWGKAEFFNPGGSVKDRIGLAIIEAAEREGRLGPGGSVVEGTSGNTGVGLAIAAAVRGYRCVFVIPDKMSIEKVHLLKAFGAEVVITPSAVEPDHPDYYGNVAKRIAAERPNSILADQFFNPVNPEAHYRATGPEIWEQTGGRITHFVASPGTGGTITGVARFLKEKNPEVRVIAGDPEGSIFVGYFRTGSKGKGHPYKVEGIGNDKLPSTLDFDLIDEFHTVDDRTSFLMARRITREEGLFVGGSTGLIVHVAAATARAVDDPDACVVCLLCDTGERYLSKLYDDAWMRDNRMLVPERATAANLVEAKPEGVLALVAIGPEAPVREAIALLEGHGISQLPVLSDGRVTGSVSEGALLSAVLDDPVRLDEPVGALAGAAFPAVPEDTAVEELAKVLRRTPAVIVTRDGTPVGLLTRHDVLHHLI